ncbi:MAG: hypothetical protein H0W83_18410 [Planctomycetes bacterium]|nr:hypothetical protein [Planctomycetota bacterium]
MSDLYFNSIFGDGELRPVPLGQVGEPASLYLMEEWVPEPLLTPAAYSGPDAGA